MLRTLNLVLLDPGGPSQFGSNYYRFGPSQSKNLSSYNWDPTVQWTHGQSGFVQSPSICVYTAIHVNSWFKLTRDPANRERP